MPPTRTTAVTLLVVLGLASPAHADALLVGRVTDLLSRPVPNIRVHVLTPGDHQIVTTDTAGEYRVTVDANKQIAIVVGAVLRLDFEVEIADGEIIRIIDDKVPTVPPKLPANAPRITPPYSVEAMERDAWLLLDIDATGKVTRVKLVKRPGLDLDDIAVKEAMKLRFEPARDERDQPMRTTIYWAMEWPSHGWLFEHQGTATRLRQSRRRVLDHLNVTETEMPLQAPVSFIEMNVLPA